MKKIYSLLLAFFAYFMVNAQTDAASHFITVTNSGSGILKIVYYGSADGYSFFSPGSGNPIYVYSWINTSDNSTGNAYNDKWSTVPPVVLNYDSGTDTFVGQIDLSTHNFDNQGGVLPGGTSVNRYNFLFRNADGSYQSADTYQLFSPTVLIPSLAVSDVAKSGKSIVANGQLYTSKKGNLNLTVYDISGKLVKTMTVKADGNAIDLNTQKGLYLVKISDGTSTEVVKFAK